ncbi:MAG TPA: DMT family transporter [Candidatus Limnocylindrales bacterium]|nr:DMT family transporter [Candidatus Limnocylindrales bacterium]
MIAILGGLGTAVLWATTLLGSARASRVIGAWSTLAWVMLVGLALAVPFLIVGGGDVHLTERDLLHLAVAGLANTGGLLFVYTALRRGKVAVVGPIVSTEGAIAATLAVLAGDPVAGPAIAVLALIAVGVVMAATERPAGAADPAGDPRAFVAAPGALGTALLAVAGALLFGVNLYVTSRLATDLPLAWAVLPARVAGVLGVTLPLVLTRRLRLTRAVAPFVILVGVAEVAGVVTFGIGARESAAVTAVIASQFAGVAAIAAFLLFGERLGRIQVAGVVIIALGVAALAYLQA